MPAGMKGSGHVVFSHGATKRVVNFQVTQNSLRQLRVNEFANIITKIIILIINQFSFFMRNLLK